jgi:hypothetical protein
MVKDQETESSSVFSYINNYINRYTSLPTADALVPINPMRMPSYYIGSMLTSDQRLERNDFMQPWENVESSLEYLSSSHNDSHYNTRFQKFMFDTAVVNGLCEVPSSIGGALAGSYANSMAAQYSDEIVEDEINKPLETQFSCELRLRGGPGSKSGNHTTPPLFNGVDLMKEHLPSSQRTNPIFGPRLPARKDRPLWSYKFFGNNGAAYIMPNSDLVIRFPVGNLIRKILFKGCGSKIVSNGFNLLVLLSYVRYAIFIKRFIAIYGIKYLNFFRTKLICIVVTGSNLILKKIRKFSSKVKFRRFRFKRKAKKPLR